MMNTVVLKCMLILIMIFVTVIAGIFPVRILQVLRLRAAHAASSKKQRYVSLTLCLLTCFSGGVFLATCFLHLLPELQDHLEIMREQYGITTDYPLAELLSCLGFFLLFLFEECVLILVPSVGHGHRHPGHMHDSGDFHIAESNGQTRLITDEASQPLRLPSESHLIEIAGTSTVAPQEQIADGANSHQVSDTDVCANKKKCPSVSLAEPERCELNCDAEEVPPIPMRSHPHAHSHGIRSITFVLAISFHSVVEGLALGVQKENSKVMTLFLSLMVHKMIVAFSMGLQLARTHAHALRWVALSIVLFSVMTPAGALVGMFVRTAPIDPYMRDFVVLLCQGISVGTFIYVTFFEVLIHERDNEHPNLLKILSMLVGFTLIGCLRLFENSHDHSGSAVALPTGDHHHHHH